MRRKHCFWTRQSVRLAPERNYLSGFGGCQVVKTGIKTIIVMRYTLWPEPFIKESASSVFALAHYSERVRNPALPPATGIRSRQVATHAAMGGAWSSSPFRSPGWPHSIRSRAMMARTIASRSWRRRARASSAHAGMS